tara:strand:- start:168 stop:281 length:114 start_codon:yes stop_codon:yes gene_type:complete
MYLKSCASMRLAKLLRTEKQTLKNGNNGGVSHYEKKT